MNICFITAGPIEWASSRMRGFWVAEALRERGHDVDVSTLSEFQAYSYPNHYEAYIWQKGVNLEKLKQLDSGRHYWDVCDPAWWWQPNECREITKHMTAVVASSKALADDFNEWHGEDTAVCIPDRLKLSHFHTQRQHRDVSPVRLIWFGVAVNRIALWAAKANLERLVANGHKIELTIFDNRPDVRFDFSEAFPIYHAKWELSTEVDVLSSHDIALLPPYPGPWGKVKSNNKALTAWACGLPEWDGTDYRVGATLTKCAHRTYRANEGLAYVEAVYPMEQSAIEWEELLS